jgi:glucose-6-phosphate 1-dehydrogenase
MTGVTQPEGPMPGRDWCPTVDTARCTSPAALIVFGATGDLAHRKLIPAIYSLTADDLLPCGLPIVCVGRRAANRAELVEWLRRGVDEHARRRPPDRNTWQQLAERIQYVRGDLHDPALYEAIRDVFGWAENSCPAGMGRLFYLATPSESFEAILQHLKRHRLITPDADGEHWSRVVIEKPFGRDAADARELDRLVTALFSEDQVYRMDHYLGKETVQNIAVLRFANSIFEPLWNERHIEHVQITVSEAVGIEGRAGFFDATGTLRDVVQNHVLQMLALVAMEPPISMDPDALRDEKLKVLRSLRALTPEDVATSVVRGRYGAGAVDGEMVPGYLQEPRIPPGSLTETFVAMRVYVDNWRWGGVPFYLRAGKRMARRLTEIVVTFKRAPHLVFGGERQGVEQNHLIIRIQPDEGLRLCFSAKSPGPGVQIDQVPMDFAYARTFAHEPPEAYERLILDALTGDRTLFARGDGVETAWEFLDPILKYWAASAEAPKEYPAGSWGPAEADALIGRTGHRWHDPGDDEADACCRR